MNNYLHKTCMQIDMYQLAMHELRGQLVYRMFSASVCWSVHPNYHMCNNYVTYTIDMG